MIGDTGKWKPVFDWWYIDEIQEWEEKLVGYSCSCCHEEVYEKFEECPNCGAKMD